MDIIFNDIVNVSFLTKRLGLDHEQGTGVIFSVFDVSKVFTNFKFSSHLSLASHTADNRFSVPTDILLDGCAPPPPPLTTGYLFVSDHIKESIVTM